MAKGRPPAEGQLRSETLKVRLTPALAADIDASRGTQTRSDFARDALRDAVRALEEGL